MGGPAQVLGAFTMFGSCALYCTRITNPKIAKDGDIVVFSVGVLVGGILAFQGWRLDPLLLLGQLMTTGVAIGFAVDAHKLETDANVLDSYVKSYNYSNAGYRISESLERDQSPFYRSEKMSVPANEDI